MANVGFFERYKVGTRIYGGFAAVLLLLGGVGWAGFAGLSGADHGLSEYARVSNNTIFVVSMAASAQEMRRHVVVGQGSGRGVRRTGRRARQGYPQTNGPVNKEVEVVSNVDSALPGFGRNGREGIVWRAAKSSRRACG